MERKPIILIMTSKDENTGLSEAVAESVRKIGTHNVVILSDDKYGSAKKLSALDRLMDSGGEYQYVLEKRDRSVLRAKFRLHSLSKRVTRIHNAVKRYNPEYILAVTPYAHHCAVEAKRRSRFKTPVMYYMPSFTLDKRGYDDATSVFIVENQDIKSALVRNGIHSKNVMTMGFPFEAKRMSAQEIVTAKQEYGLPRAKSVFLNVGDKKKLEEIFSLLLDQGDVINLVVYCEDGKEIAALRAKSARVRNMTVLFVADRESFDSYLAVCDIAVTHYDTSTLYKCMKLGVPSITFGEGAQTTNEITYLVSNGLALRAKESMEIVGLVYKLLQTDAAFNIAQAGEKWVEFNSADNIASFLASYIAV